MNKFYMTTQKAIALLLTLATVLGCMAGCGTQGAVSNGNKGVSAGDAYSYTNPDETKAEPDAGIVIDGVLDEEAYQNNNWLYLNNDHGGNNVNIAMTSHFGEKGMYFVYDVTETVPIYVNLDRASYMNSCIEMYLVPSYLTSLKGNSMFEIDLMPSGDLIFKKSNGKYGYENVETRNDIMAHLGATTKGGELNTPECYGYCLELFIPWDYMEWLKMDVESMKNSFVYINPAHITSNNFAGTDTNLDRYWYHYAQQNGSDFNNILQYFRFDGNGVIGSAPMEVGETANCTINGKDSVFPGLKTTLNFKPDEGHALTSIIINGEEQIQNVSFEEDGSVTLKVRVPEKGLKVSAKAEPTTEGTKTIRGKVVLNNLVKDTFKGLLLSYIGPKGEKPLEIDEKGNFELKDLEQGYYVLKAEKEGYISVNRGICLNQDIYTEVTLEYDTFKVTGGVSYVLDEQNNGLLYKFGGTGNVLSNNSYKNLTLVVPVKYDKELAKLSKDDLFTQQRSGVRLTFSNGKTWHIDVLKEGKDYILQYAKFSGNDSVFNWKTLYKLNDDEIKQYQSDEGIKLSVMREGRYAAIWVGTRLIGVQTLNNAYSTCTVQAGMESWIANRDFMEIPFTMRAGVPADIAGSPFHWPAKDWDISGQYYGFITKDNEKGSTKWQDSVINANLVKTRAQDLTPDAFDYSWAYIFKFSNNQNARIRLTHDKDGNYYVQTMAGNTLTPNWKLYYKLTEEQVAKIQGEGIEYGVEILGTTAYVTLDGEDVCSIDLSQIHKDGNSTGKPSGIEKETCKVSFSLDGNNGHTTMIPFELVDSTEDATVKIGDMEYGTVTADQEKYKLGDTITLNVTSDEGYYYDEITLDGQPIDFDWDGVYSFTATKNRHYVTGRFSEGKFAENSEAEWNLLKQNQNILHLNSHEEGDSGWLTSAIEANDISTTIKDTDPAAKDFGMTYHLDFSNGESLRLSLNNGEDGKYKIQVMGESTLAAEKDLYTLTDAEAEKIKGDGIAFRVVAEGENAEVYIGETKVATLPLSKPVDSDAQVQIKMDGNLNQDMDIPYRMVDTAKVVVVNIDAMTNGKVTADKEEYMLGDTIILTVTPDADYSQKVFINGDALLLDWKTDTYTFEAAENVYNVTGGFEKSKDIVPKDENRWDDANQAHGVLSTYYPSNNDSWWMDINGEYRSVAVTAKNYLPTEESKDDGGSVPGFHTILRMVLDNGKAYAFRIYNDKGTYAVSCSGESGAVTGWSNWKNINDLADAITGDGVNFKVERTAANKLAVSVNGNVLITYTMDGVTAANKVVSVGINSKGNKNEYIDVPFVLKTPTDAPDVTLNIAEMTNGTVTPELGAYQVGDTITLNVAPDAGYSQRLYVDGEALKLDWKTNTYSFEATKEVYNITGSFEPSIDAVAKDAGRWDTANQAHGVLNTYYPSNNDSWWMDINGEYRSFAVTSKNYLPTEESKDDGGSVPGFHTIIRMVLDNGKAYAFRIYNDKGTYAVSCSGESGAVTGWSNWKNINDLADAITGDGVTFKVERTAADKLAVSVNGNVLITYTMDGVTEANKVVSVGLNSKGNKGQYIEIPYVLKTPTDPADVQLNIAALTNGKVIADRTNYMVGDTITLTVTPDAGYAQKLYINGEALKLDWKTNTYSFEATEEVYNVTGSFEPSLTLTPSDAGRWDTANQAHGVLNAYYPNDNDSWWVDIEGEYRSVSVKAKNYLSIEDSKDGINGSVGFATILRVKMDNGKIYAFRVYNDKGTYAYAWFGSGGSATGWGGWKNIHSAYAADFNGDGVDFKLERTSANTLTLSLNDTVVGTYTMADVTAANKVVSVGIQHNGNKGQKVEIPYVLKTPTDAPDVTLNIAEMTGGTVTPELEKYQVGDTVTLKVTPDAGYAQKLYINGEALKLDWKTNTYSFVATEEVYNITGSFEPAVSIVPKDTGRWDTANHAHGVLNTYYPANGDSWWVDINGEYQSISVKAKNYLPLADTLDKFNTILRVTMDNGNVYSFRFYADKNGSYAYNRYGIKNNGDSTADWGGWKGLGQYNETAGTDGVDFKLERTAANVLTLSVNGSMVDLYTMKGITAENKVVSVGIQHNGNQGQYVEIPYVVTKPDPRADVELNIAELTNGTVTADKESYKVGDTVTLTVTPEAGYAQKLYINGEALKLDWKTNTYSFEATEEVYNVTGSFVTSLNLVASDGNRWDTANQAHGVLNTYYPSNNDSWWMAFKGEYASLTVKAKNYLPIADTKDNFMVVLRVTLDNGKVYSFRVMTDKGGYTAYNRAGIQNAGDASADWGNWKNLSSLDSLITTVGVDYKVERTAGNVLKLSVNGEVLDTYTMAGVTADNKITEIAVKHQGNKGQYIEIPYVLTEPVVIPDVTLNIPENLYGGTITADKESYKVGDTVTLTVTAEEGYAQKLYINGKELKLDWKTNTYSFEATEEVYNVTGSFAQSLNLAASDGNRWDTANQAHGVLNTYYPSNNDSWWMDVKGEYKSITVKAKNYWPVADSYEGIANGGGFRITLRANMDNGKNYAFSIWINTDKVYAYNHFGGGGSATGWGGAWCLVAEKNADAVAALNGDGADFKLERIDGNHFQISINGTVLETYTIPDVTSANKVVSMGVQHNGNKGEYVEIPYVMEKEIPSVTLNIPENLYGGTITADKESYKVGDTVTLTVTAEEGYVQKLYINNQPLMLDWTTGKYTFVATQDKYEITGSFASNGFAAQGVEYNLINAGHKVLLAPGNSTPNNKSLTFTGNYQTVSVFLKDVSNYTQNEYNIPITFKFQNADGVEKTLSIRAISWTSSARKYVVQSMTGNFVANWTRLTDLTDYAAAICGEGVWFTMARNGDKMDIKINDTVVYTVDLSTEGVTAESAVTSVSFDYYNYNLDAEVKYNVQ